MNGQPVLADVQRPPDPLRRMVMARHDCATDRAPQRHILAVVHPDIHPLSVIVRFHTHDFPRRLYPKPLRDDVPREVTILIPGIHFGRLHVPIYHTFPPRSHSDPPKTLKGLFGTGGDICVFIDMWGQSAGGGK